MKRARVFLCVTLYAEMFGELRYIYMLFSNTLWAFSYDNNGYTQIAWWEMKESMLHSSGTWTIRYAPIACTSNYCCFVFSFAEGQNICNAWQNSRATKAKAKILNSFSPHRQIYHSHILYVSVCFASFWRSDNTAGCENTIIIYIF